ncbi:Endoribonuclease L-PSP/chorismate mutase-like protein [Aspergillus taichungensis]|uniref:Endoribonuclease L-PSP/chorismate mutase-like protein n=1 Tax=Aspergillus taichungensis TaxID=482145 RepID=A0A2J5I1V0_9EURO|nr:Endoribonuclease L-PSP/chorismate mutase-like protein [Aspergillus taichungensis]
MSSFTYHSLPGFGEQCCEEYGFSDACIIGDRIIVTGQTGMNPITLQTSADIGEQVAQAFENINNLIVHALGKEGHPAHHEGKSGWEHVVKLHAYFVGLSSIRDQARALMVRSIKQWCPNHQPLFTMVGIESLPFPEHHVELEVFVQARMVRFVTNESAS